MSDQTSLDPNAVGASVIYQLHPPPHERPGQRVAEAIRDKVESGKLDPADLQSRLTGNFGDKADGIVSEDGTIDYAKLGKVVAEFQAAIDNRVRDRLGNGVRQAPPPGPDQPVDPATHDADLEIPYVPAVASVVPEPPKTPEPHGIRQFVDKILHELVGEDLDSGKLVNLKT